MLVFTAAYTTVFNRVQGLIEPYMYYLSSYIHFGTYLCSLLCFAASLKYLHSQNLYLLLGIVIISFITTVSDLIFAIYFTIPFIITLGIIKRIDPALFGNNRRLSYILFLASFTAYIFNKYLDPLAATTTIKIKLAIILSTIKKMVLDIWQIEFSQQLFLLLTIILPLVCIAWYLAIAKKQLGRNGQKAKAQNEAASLFFTSLFVIISCATSISAVVILGKYTDESQTRYLTTLYYSPGLVALIIISLRLEKAKSKLINFLAVAGLVTITLAAGTSLIGKEFIISQILAPPDYASCFDLNKSQAGLAGYWHSKPLIAYSQRQIQIATIKEDGHPYTSNSNRYWYTDSWQNPGNQPQFKFILMDTLDKSAIAARYGMPDRVEACNNSEVWWYKNSDALYSNLMRDGL